MASKNNAELRHDFPAGLAQPALRALAAAGYTSLEQLSTTTEADLSKLHGLGPKGLRLIREALDARGLAFAGPVSDQPTSATTEEVIDSPSDWVRGHIRDYVESGGEKGYLWRGYPTLLLTTRGRKSGKLRRTGLIFGRDGQNYVVVASKGGAPQHPLWYLNLLDHPEVEIQVGAEKIAGRARPVTPEEKPRLWSLMTGIYPPYLEYQAKTARDIPVVIIEPLA